jgi:glycosyltransferase involved in cell wall biosynthesis
MDVWESCAHLPLLLLSGRAKTPAAEAARASLEREVGRRRLEGRIRFAGTVGDMPALIAGSEALLFPATSLHAKTDLPLVILEAWRECRPVFASDLPPLLESIREGGVVLPPSRDTWIQALSEWRETGPALGSAGRAKFESTFSARSAASAYAALYDDLGREFSISER